MNSVLAAVAIVMVALIGRWQRQGRKEATKDREALHAKQSEISNRLDGENGHPSLGAGIAAIEERQIEQQQAVDKLTAQTSETLMLAAETRSEMRHQRTLLDKHLDEWDPLLDWAERAAAKDRKRKG